MSERRRGLGRGLGALIPAATVTPPPPAQSVSGRPVDVFFETSTVSDSAAATGQNAPAEGKNPAGMLDLRESSAAASRASRSGRGTGATIPKARAKEQASVQPAAPKSAPATGGGDAASVPAARSKQDVSVSKKGKPSKAASVAPDTGSVQDSAADVSDPSNAAGDSAGQQGDGPELVEVPGATYAHLPVGDIRPNAVQPRHVFDEDDMAELVHSIQTIGILQPIVVRTATDGDTPYELIMGERRWRAAKAAGLERVPAIIRSTDDDAMLRDALLENLHRSQLNPLEEAAAYEQLLQDFGCTHEELAKRIGRSRPQISNTVRLLKLPPLVQRRVSAGVLSAGHARALLALDDPAAMERLAQRIVAEGLSVRTTEEIVALGDGSRKTSGKRKPAPLTELAAQRASIATELSDLFDTRVHISGGPKKGKITIEFADEKDFERVMEALQSGRTR